MLINVKLHPRPYPQASGPLEPYYAGPYKVIEKVGPNSFRVRLPAKARINRVHDVFNITSLKKYHSETVLLDVVDPPPVPPDNADDEADADDEEDVERDDPPVPTTKLLCVNILCVLRCTLRCGKHVFVL